MCELCVGKHPTRRGVLLQGAAAALTFSSQAHADAVGANAPNAIPPAAALKRLLDGNAHYVASGMHCADVGHGRAAQAKAQYPIAAVVGCADSRVVPELAFDQGPGDLFVIRVAGNFVNEDGLASLEYGAAVLGVPLIMVLGHSNCGAVAAAIKVVKEKAHLPGHLPELVESITPAVVAAAAKHPSDLLAAAIIENVRLNVGRLIQAKPIIAAKVKAQKLQVIGGVYDIASGRVALV